MAGAAADQVCGPDRTNPAARGLRACEARGGAAEGLPTSGGLLRAAAPRSLSLARSRGAVRARLLADLTRTRHSVKLSPIEEHLNLPWF